MTDFLTPIRGAMVMWPLIVAAGAVIGSVMGLGLAALAELRAALRAAWSRPTPRFVDKRYHLTDRHELVVTEVWALSNGQIELAQDPIYTVGMP